jgi:hypothetical protein
MSEATPGGDPRPVARIAIVGAGPRGVVVLERICANLDVVAPGHQVEVHMIDPYPPGGGRVWNEAQNRDLVMNTVTGDITVFTDPSVRCAGPIRPGPTQYQWARMVADGQISGLDERTMAEARELTPWSYATRAFQGAYLAWALRHILDGAPAGVRVRFHRTRAVALDDLPAGCQALRLESGEVLDVHAVILAMGHFDVAPTDEQQGLVDFAERRGLTYVPPASPSEIELDTIEAGAPVIVRGLGLNFFDYVALLTVGRGGEFRRADGQRLTYLPSGAEPVLYAGSTRGVPHTARAEVEQEVVLKYRATFLTKEIIERLRSRAGTGCTDFMADVWPLVAKEAGWVYYQHLFSHGDTADERALGRLCAEYPALDWGSEPMSALIADLVPDPALRWDWSTFERPAHGQRFPDRSDYQRWVIDRLTRDYVHAKAGPAGSAVKAISAMMRDLRDDLRYIVSHRGLSGSSYRHHIDGWFSGLMNYVASGPPASRLAELIALAEAGVVRFVGPDMVVRADEAAGCFVTCSPAVGGEAVAGPALIDAHLPLTDLRRVTDPLLRYLLTRGRCRPHILVDRDGTEFQTGGLDITEGEQWLVEADGTPHRGRFSLGPPVEAVQWVTAIGARPHVNSRTLLQGDRIALAALTTAVESAATPGRSSTAA